MAVLKKTTDPKAVEKLAFKIADMRKRVTKDNLKIAKKDKKLLKAKKIKASPAKALVNLAKKREESAKKKVIKLKGQIAADQAAITESNDPNKVQKLMTKIIDAKREIQRHLREVVRRKARVTKIKKLKTVPKAPPKKISKVRLLSRSSHKVRRDKKVVDKLEINVKAAKVAFAASMNAVLRAKEGKEKARVKNAKASARITKKFFRRAQRRSKQINRQADLEQKVSTTLKRIKHGFVSGKYHIAYSAHAEHVRRQKKKRQRSASAKATARAMFAVPSSKSGVCLRGKCCLTAYTDGKCKKRKASLCAAAAAKPVVPKWTPIVQIKTTFTRKISSPDMASNCTANCTVAFKRTMKVQAQWSPVSAKKNGQVLRLRVCGKFTQFGSKGADACYPRKGMGFSLARVFNAPAGSCIHAEDFVAVSRPKLKQQVRRLMRKLSRKQVAKKAKLADKLKSMRVAKGSQIERITRSVSRAIGGVFKGAMGGVSRLGEVQSDPTEFIDEGLAAVFKKQLFANGGSFMITAVAPPKVAKKSTSKGSVTQPKELEEVVELSY